MMRLLRSWIAATLALGVCSAPALAQSSAHVRLQALARDMTFGWARSHPLVATTLGISGEDGLLPIPTRATRARDVATIERWQARLNDISLDGAALVDRDDAALIRAQLTSYLRGLTVYRSDEKDYSGPAQAVTNAIFTQFQHVPIAGRDGATVSDVRRAWDAIVSRLERGPAYIAAGQRLVTTPGHLYGVFGAKQLAGAPDFYDGALTDAARSALSAGGFVAFVRARDALTKTIRATKRYIDGHVASWPENYAIGPSAYDAMLRDEQLLPFTSSDIERMARDELAHGWAQQFWLEGLARSRGTPLGAQSGGGLAPGGAALIGYYRGRITQLNRFIRDNRVIDIPPWLGSIKVVETPKFLQPVQPGASMDSPRLFSSETTGYYYITPPSSLAGAARALDLYEDFDSDRILSTAAHETIPGHFLQLSIARRHPDFVRRIQTSGVFAEGWAYYGEEMFVRLGLYGTHLDGPLDVAQWERIRGARAIVDAKLATGEWSFRQAVDFFARETGTTHDETEAAVAGIALGPGYVISYTAGRFQLESLLGQYMQRRRAAASLRDFHDRLMCYGTTPFAVVGPELLRDLDKPLAAVRAAARY